MGTSDEAATESAAAGLYERVRGRTVLLVDDDHLVLDAFREALVGCQIDVSTASSVSEALRLLEERAYDLIVTDIAMPRETGYDLMERIAQRGNRTPVVALTAHAGPEEKNRIVASGFRTIVTKPTSIANLLQAMAEALD
jgi:CheY-like chemotaxis protein